MSDTPETDEIALHPATTNWVWREHSRKLERERNEAMALASLVGNRPIATPCRDSCRDHEIEGWTNKWECAVEMAARAENTVDYLLGILADIRVAVGDKEGQLTQDELVEHCRMLKREYDRSY